MRTKKPACDWDCFNCKFPDCIRDGSESPKGLCKNCLSRPAVPGMTLCDVCREKNRIRSKSIREQRKAAGLCAKCGKRPPAPGMASCDECLRYERERVKAIRMKKGGGASDLQTP